MGGKISINIKRYEPVEDKEGYFVKFDIPEEITHGMTIVGALRYVQENIDPSLSFYYSCELAKCRGCLLEVNGKATFACTEPVQHGQRIEPLSHLPVIRDLSVKFIDSLIAVDAKLCTACGACVEECPMDIFEVSEPDQIVVARDGTLRGFCGKGDMVDCIGCRRCEMACSTGAITISANNKNNT